MKINKIRNLLLILILISIACPVFSQSAKEKLMTVTARSESALSLYKKAKKYYDDVNLEKALETFGNALDEDPDFFMANYQLAMYYLLNGEPDDFNKYAYAAKKCKARLSEAEELLKQALMRLSNGYTNVADIGEKLVEMYPYDPESYNNLATFQMIEKDNDGLVETLLKAIKIVPDPAPFYNQLGYAYLALKQTDKAEEAFDKYIELSPRNPNVYDSKGDYYMYLKKYDKAYESYMKAYSINPSFSREKAKAAEKLYEQTEGRKIQIIPM